MEKGAAMIYETVVRPEDKIHRPWKERLEQQLSSAVELLEQRVRGKSVPLYSGAVSQADIDVAIVGFETLLRSFYFHSLNIFLRSIACSFFTFSSSNK